MRRPHANRFNPAPRKKREGVGRHWTGVANRWFPEYTAHPKVSQYRPAR
ncbi:hypothetical protein PCE31107_04064 [Pandoraea cepalis]|uniref:Uncharacterized protein n=1 Tax=Pandoraea cepalis TaxID=2508294 RepID=A0A5E4XRQ9_9BURK|nr:hypothetical protein PCE31107_04064 [Pandoraea cepalis]